MAGNQEGAVGVGTLPAEVREKVWKSVATKAWPSISVASKAAAADIQALAWHQVCFVGIALRANFDAGRIEASLSLKTSIPDLSLSVFAIDPDMTPHCGLDKRWGSFYDLPVKDLVAALAYLSNHLRLSNIRALVIEMTALSGLAALQGMGKKETDAVSHFMSPFTSLRHVVLVNVACNMKGLWRVPRVVDGLDHVSLIETNDPSDTTKRMMGNIRDLNIRRFDKATMYECDYSPTDCEIIPKVVEDYRMDTPSFYHYPGSFLGHFSQLRRLDLGQSKDYTSVMKDRWFYYNHNYENVGAVDTYVRLLDEILPPIIVHLRSNRRSLRISGLCLDASNAPEEKNLVLALNGMLEPAMKERVDELWSKKAEADGAHRFHLRIHLADDTATLHLKGILKNS